VPYSSFENHLAKTAAITRETREVKTRPDAKKADFTARDWIIVSVLPSLEELGL